MPPSPQPIPPHMYAHRKKMIATAFVLMLILALVAFIAFVARKNQRNAEFEKWYQQEQVRRSQENLKVFAGSLPEQPSLEEATARAQANLKAFADGLPEKPEVNLELTNQSLQDFAAQVEAEKEAAKKQYFENQ